MTHTPSDADRLDRLECRLAELEAERAIARLLASYGPIVDSGSAERAASLWEPHGVYDVDNLLMDGPAEIDAMVRGDLHQGIITGGSAHLLGPHQITVDGDTAVAIGHSLLVRHEDGRFVVARATAHHWSLCQGPEGWRVVRRVARVLDGRAEARALLALAADPAGSSPATSPARA
ncbi:nuclear transport factor 2 family protein [Streptomyces antibioticus]|uniref:nuclear transport factor 2 family protein n=1 Tax=Streptomyces antibioticus TaxID=1890 RepID=UPI00368731E4